MDKLIPICILVVIIIIGFISKVADLSSINKRIEFTSSYREKFIKFIKKIIEEHIFDNTIYQELNYAVFEDYQYKITKIVAGKKESNLTLKEYLKKLKISVDNYNQSCKVLTKSNLYIELHLQDKDKLTTYTIPLLLEDNC